MMTGEQMTAWRHRCGLRKGRACALLDITYGTLSQYESGTRRDNGAEVRIPETVALACTAIAFGLPSWGDPEAEQLLDAIAPGRTSEDERLAAIRCALYPAS